MANCLFHQSLLLPLNTASSSLTSIKAITSIVFVVPARRSNLKVRSLKLGECKVRASMVDSSQENPSNFSKRMEQAWLISQQPTPTPCSTCQAKGLIECKWCRGTGFFILGDNMLCQVPSRDTTCVICAGKGSMRCPDCKSTGFRARWLEEPQSSQQ